MLTSAGDTSSRDSAVTSGVAMAAAADCGQRKVGHSTQQY